MKFVLPTLFAVAALLSGTFAGVPCIIVDPTFLSPWPIGSVQLISWTSPDPTLFPINVYWDDGSSTDLSINVPAIISALPVSPNSYYYTVPSSISGVPLVVGTNYSIQFGLAPNVAYSPQFTITAGTGVPPPTTPAPPPASSVPLVSGLSVSRSNMSRSANFSSSAVTSATGVLFQNSLTSTTSTSTSNSSSAPAATSTSATSSKSAGSTLTPVSLGSFIAALSFALFNL